MHLLLDDERSDDEDDGNADWKTTSRLRMELRAPSVV